MNKYDGGIYKIVILDFKGICIVLVKKWIVTFRDILLI